MRWLARESRLRFVLGCEELKPTGKSMNLEAETTATWLHVKHRTVTQQHINPTAASLRTVTRGNSAI